MIFVKSTTSSHRGPSEPINTKIKKETKKISDLEHPETGAALDIPEPDGVVRAAGDHESVQDKIRWDLCSHFACFADLS